MVYLEKIFTDKNLDIPASNWTESIEMLLKANLYFLEVVWDEHYSLDKWQKQRVETSEARADLICNTPGEEIKVAYPDFLPDDEKKFFKSMNYVFSLILKHTDLFQTCMYGNSANEKIWPIIPFIDPIMGKSVALFSKWHSKRQISFVSYEELKTWDTKIYTRKENEKSSFCDRYVLFTPAN